MPLTKEPESSVEYVLTNSTASSMTTAIGGPSGARRLGHGQSCKTSRSMTAHTFDRPAHRSGSDPGIRFGPGGLGPLEQGADVVVGADRQLPQNVERALALQLCFIEQGQGSLALLVAR